jgi:deoxyribodipyrimidine photolyase
LEEKKEAGKVCGYRFKESVYKCNRDALPGDEHCIFHSREIKAKKDKFYNFYNAFWKNSRDRPPIGY